MRLEGHLDGPILKALIWTTPGWFPFTHPILYALLKTWSLGPGQRQLAMPEK